MSRCPVQVVAGFRGGSRIPKGGGHNYVTVSMVIVYEVLTQSGMQSMPNLGGSEGMPLQENFEKLNPLRLNLRASLLSLPLQDSALHNIEIYLIK